MHFPANEDFMTLTSMKYNNNITSAIDPTQLNQVGQETSIWDKKKINK